MNKRLFLDTNIILDLLSRRKPFYDSIAKIATLAEKQNVTLVVSPISFATVHYFLTKFENEEIARKKLIMFKTISEVCTVNNQIIDKGLNSSMKDFEDALQYMSALSTNCDIILTRNGKDFKKSKLPVMTADEYLKSLL